MSEIRCLILLLLLLFLSLLSGFFCSLQSLCGSFYSVFTFFLCIIALFVYDHCVCAVCCAPHKHNQYAMMWISRLFAPVESARRHRRDQSTHPLDSTQKQNRTEQNWTEQSNAAGDVQQQREWETVKWSALSSCCDLEISVEIVVQSCRASKPDLVNRSDSLRPDLSRAGLVGASNKREKQNRSKTQTVAIVDNLETNTHAHTTRA